MRDEVTLFQRLWQFKGGVNPQNDGLGLEMPYLRIEATLKVDLKVLASDYKDTPERILPAGTRVRIWTVSRFQWAGLSDDLSENCRGYDICVGGEPHTIYPGKLEDYLTDVTIKL